MLKLPDIPKSLLRTVYELPYEPQAHHEAPDNLAAEHALFGWNTVAAGHLVRFVMEGDRLAADACGMYERTCRRVRGPYANLLAAAVSLEAGVWYAQAAKGPYWLADGLREYDPMHTHHADKLQAYVAIAIVSPDGNEQLVLRRGYLHHEAHYCGRLSLVCSPLTLIELGREWGLYEWGATEVAAVRTLCAHIAPPRVLQEMLANLSDQWPIRTRLPADASDQPGPVCFLAGIEGKPLLMRHALFCTRAESEQQWRGWVDALTGPVDPARASFIVRSRAELLDDAEHDAQEWRTQSAHLAAYGKRLDADEVPSALCFPNRESASFEEQLAEFHQGRQEAHRDGRLPFTGRGSFRFVGGHARFVHRL